MKGENSSPSEDNLSGPNADAIRDARRRVREREDAERAHREAINRERARAMWRLDFGPGTMGGPLAELFGPHLATAAALIGLWLLLSALLWLVEALREPLYWLIRTLDTVAGARALAGAPWMMWTLWGGIFGGALGYWLIAPLYGNRENRSLSLWLPLLAMVVLGVMLWAFGR